MVLVLVGMLIRLFFQIVVKSILWFPYLCLRHASKLWGEVQDPGLSEGLALVIILGGAIQPDLELASKSQAH